MTGGIELASDRSERCWLGPSVRRRSGLKRVPSGSMNHSFSEASLRSLRCSLKASSGSTTFCWPACWPLATRSQMDGFLVALRPKSSSASSSPAPSSPASRAACALLASASSAARSALIFSLAAAASASACWSFSVSSFSKAVSSNSSSSGETCAVPSPTFCFRAWNCLPSRAPHELNLSPKGSSSSSPRPSSLHFLTRW
mmetsp:Transcript_12676/g.29827  ORF Transcript_12676/g.29827 Transcript_12676/m.29827 type:complete len:200 (-) Transcript_12676:94-693(-)